GGRGGAEVQTPDLRYFAAEALGKDRIFLGIDSPYEKIDESLQFLEGLPMSREDLEKIREENRSLKDRLEKVENRAAGASKRRSKPLSSRHERD
ncbi:MAG: hypothetical protein P8Z49_10555, partial [Acidobacteriota bacterium]